MTNVPSLYVRVYRGEANVYCLNPSSLTIREGISILLTDAGRPPPVPSLYVRVYRLWWTAEEKWVRSLTIREGISPYLSPPAACNLFPHYTWGYIGWQKRKRDRQKVPSLYVRVYHLSFSSFVFPWSSLTIREGISLSLRETSLVSLFPHYTWGYIAENNAATCGRSVPSLYVRVYRNFRCRVSVSVCSLTIREGISKRNAKKDAKIAFPHYMWGYIGHFRFFQNPAY